MGTYVQLYTCFQYIITYDQVNHHASAYLASACGPGISTSKLPMHLERANRRVCGQFWAVMQAEGTPNTGLPPTGWTSTPSISHLAPFYMYPWALCVVWVMRMKG